MKILRSLILITALALAAWPAAAASLPTNARAPIDPRAELAEWFASVDRNAPTVLGGLADSPETMAAIQKRIASMSDEEAQRLGALMQQAPDWRLAPEAVVGAFPIDVRAQIERAGKDIATRSPQSSRTREQLQTLAKVLEQMPEAKLNELGVDRKLVQSLGQTLAGMSPVETAALQTRPGAAPLGEKSAAAMRALPPQLQRGALALSEHGPLTPQDFQDLEAFRTELISLFDRISKLDPESRKALDAEELQKKVAQLTVAPPDVIFMIRLHVPEEMLASLASTLALFESVANLDAGGKAELETFRGELTETFTSVDADERSAEKTRALMAELGTPELLLMRESMAGSPGWQVWLPAFYQSLSSPQLASRVESVRGAAADPAALAEVETFRTQAFAYIDAAAASGRADAALVARARKAMMEASPERLQVVRTLVESMPPSASTDDLLAVAAMVDFGCQVDLASPFPDINLDFICNPIETALNAVESTITNTANTILNTARAAINASIGAMQIAIETSIAAVNSVIDTAVSAITNTVDEIWSFIQTIPGLAWETIQAALDLLLEIEIANGVTVGDLVAEGAESALASMRTLVGLGGEWWSAISAFTLPEIPCPDAGFHTPFGNVGESAAAQNYGRYRLLIDGIVEMIPDTETSLAIKIPAQLLYMTFDFLGTCLEQAAGAADEAELTSRHSLTLAAFTDLGTHVAGSIAGLSAASGSDAGFLVTTVQSESQGIQGLLSQRSAATRALLESRSNAGQDRIESESAGIRSMLENESSDLQEALATFRELNLRLVVERVLQAGVGAEIALLALPEPAGHLGLVKDIVQNSLDGLVAAGYSTGQATKFFEKGSALMVSGDYKNAFAHFATAYREASK